MRSTEVRSMAEARALRIAHGVALLLAAFLPARECTAQSSGGQVLADDAFCGKFLRADPSQSDTWIISSLESKRNDLQAVLDCVPEGGTLRFQNSKKRVGEKKDGGVREGVFQPNGTVVIKRPIQLDSANGEAVFSCPSSGVPLFHIRSPGVSIQNLTIQDCNLAEPSQSAVVVDVDRWAFEFQSKEPPSNPSVSFSNLLFHRNINLNSTGALLIKSVQQASLVNVSFVDNGGRDGGGMRVLAAEGEIQLEGCTFEGNFGSNTGGGMSVEAAGGLRVLGGGFRNNSAGSSGGAAHIKGGEGSNISIVGTTFENNTADDPHTEGGRGGALSVMGTGLVLRLKWAQFVGNRGFMDGGGINLAEAGGAVEIENTVFKSNVAARGGAVNAVASGPLLLNILKSNFEKNQAVVRFGGATSPTEKQKLHDGPPPEPKISAEGGALNINGKEIELNIDGVAFLKNQASGDEPAAKGGAVSISDLKSGQIRGAEFTENRVDGKNSKGGAIAMEIERKQMARVLTAIEGSECEFQCDGEMQGPDAVDGWPKVASQLNARQIFDAERSVVKIEAVVFSGNKAGRFGGAMHLAKKGLSVNMVKGVKFSENSVEKGDGGAMALQEGVEFSGNGPSFEKNKAGANGGAVWAKNEKTELKFTNTSFFSNEAGGSGGAIQLVSGPTLDLSRETQFTENQAKKHGGGIVVFGGGNIKGTDVAFHDNSALLGGGALFAKSDVEKAGVSFKSCAFVANYGGERKPGTPPPPMGKGGAIFLTGRAVHMSASFMLLNDNAAKEGGAIRLVDAGSVQISDTQLAKNTALSGGSIHVSFSEKNLHQTLTLRDVKITGSSALMGGGLMGNAKTLEGSFISEDGVLAVAFGRNSRPPKQIVMERVGFWDNVVTGSGGGMFLMDIGVDCEDCTFTRNAASQENGGAGGGIGLVDFAVLNIRGGSLMENRASAGGAVSIKNSFLDGEKVVATHNKASQKGGAMSVVVDGPILGSQTPSLALRKSTISLNTGVLGGGIHALVEGKPMRVGCETPEAIDDMHNGRVDEFGGILDSVLTGCSDLRQPNVSAASAPAQSWDVRVQLDETYLMGNTGVEAGGGVWLNEPDSLCVCCEGVCSDNCQDLEGVSQSREFRPLTDVLFEQCPPLWSENQVNPDGYGGTIASIAKSARILDGQHSTIRSIRDHKSGDALPSILVTIFDAFDQVVTKTESDVFVRATSEEGIVFGQLDKRVEDGHAHFNSTAVAARPGEYSLVVELPLGLPPRSLTVKVRECRRGEAAIQGSVLQDYRCDECRPGFFSFQPENNCTVCPDEAKAVCNGNSVVPKDGYWHPTSWSIVVKKCLVEEACTYVDRVETLQRESAALNRPITFEGDYTLCAEGYRGPLCGSCEAGYGRVQDFECSECPKRRFTILLVALVTIWSAAVVSFLIRNALAVGDPTPPSRNSRTQAILPFPIGSNSLRRQFGTEARTASPMERGGSGNLTSTDISLDTIMQEGGQNQRASNNNSNNRDGGVSKRKTTTLTPRWGASAAVEEAKILINYLQVSAVALVVNVEWRTEIKKLLALEGEPSREKSRLIQLEEFSFLP
ncbi:hypothetical protein BSKO_13368 [Bryopsis sp. KO-2023]|nr:hypothetical protein BSKO_13368 [Bryopsis sp. KO-2023]